MAMMTDKLPMLPHYSFSGCHAGSSSRHVWEFLSSQWGMSGGTGEQRMVTVHHLLIHTVCHMTSMIFFVSTEMIEKQSYLAFMSNEP